MKRGICTLACFKSRGAPPRVGPHRLSWHARGRERPRAIAKDDHAASSPRCHHARLSRHGLYGRKHSLRFHCRGRYQGQTAVVAWRSNALVFTRSAIKPFQALPFLLDDGPARFGFSRDELALLCASHSGEPMHVATVESMLAKLGLDESCLACGCHAPLYYDSVGKTPPPDVQWRSVHHNCSGKHSGFLGWCRLHGMATDGYLDRDHPLQQAVRSTLARIAGVDSAAMPTGLDGCSAPNY